jgi:uncharacterized protein YoxC
MDIEIATLPTVARNDKNSLNRGGQGVVTAPLNPLIQAVNVNTPAHSVDAITHSVDAITYSVDAITHSVDAITRSVDAITRSVDAITCSVDAITRSVDAITRSVYATSWNEKTRNLRLNTILRTVRPLELVVTVRSTRLRRASTNIISFIFDLSSRIWNFLTI